MNNFLNLEWINSGCLCNQYSFARSPNLYGIVLYKFVIPKDSSYEFFCQVFLAFFEKIKINFYLSFLFGQKKFEKNINKFLGHLVIYLWPTTTARSFNCFVCKYERYSDPCSSIAFEIIINLIIDFRKTIKPATFSFLLHLKVPVTT